MFEKVLVIGWEKNSESDTTGAIITAFQVSAKDLEVGNMLIAAVTAVLVFLVGGLLAHLVFHREPVSRQGMLIFSAVFYNAEDATRQFGRAAIAAYVDGHEGRLMRSIKSILGSDLMDEATELPGGLQVRYKIHPARTSS